MSLKDGSTRVVLQKNEPERWPDLLCLKVK